MGKLKHQTITSRTDFFYYAFRNILLVSLPLVVICGLVLSHLSFHSSARVSSSDNLSISVPSSCTLSSSVDEAHSASIINGTYESEIGKTTLTTFCNDRNGYSVYAIGDSLNSEGNNKLVSNINSNYDIVSGTATNGNTSNWAMKLTGVTTIADSNTNVTVNANTPPTITPSFTNYTTVPTEWTKAATIASGTTDMLQGSGFTITYATYISPTQAAGTYTGQVKFVMIHSTSPSVPFYIMQEVADWKDDLDEGESVQAMDSRDQKLYWVTKLADDNVWMTQNLDFDIVADEQDPTKMKTLTSEDTDLIDHSLTGAYSQSNGYSYDENTGIISWIPATTAKTINFEGATVTGWQGNNTVPYSASKTDNTNTGHASLGNYYNWTAAIASNNSNTLAIDTINDVSQNPQNSICPKGWRLPTISDNNASSTGSTNEFARLNYLYNDNSTSNDQGLIGEPLYFMYSGIIDVKNNNTLISLGSLGLYMSSTNYGAQGFYGIRFRTNGVAIEQFNNDYGGKKSGFSVRCVAR